MNKTVCWGCDKEISYEGEKYQDINCPNCGCQNSIYNPADKPLIIEPDPFDLVETNLQTEEDEMGELSKWAKENSKFLKLVDGESYEGVYKGYKEGTNMNGDPTIIYKIDDKELKSSSTKLAEEIDKIAVETKIKITRTGEGLQTKWMVETI